MHQKGLLLLLVAAIVLGLIATGIVVQGNEQQPQILQQAAASPQPEVISQPKPPQQTDVTWEYKTICVPGPFTMTAQTLNEYGKKGWEVVDWEDTGFLHFLLKRQASN